MARITLGVVVVVQDRDKGRINTLGRSVVEMIQ